MALPILKKSDNPPAVRDFDRIELTDADELELEGGRMSFLEHLDELRKRLIAMLAGVFIGCILAFIFLDPIFHFITDPMKRMLPNTGPGLITTEATEFFMLWLKVGLLSGLLIAAPWVLYQVWLFVAPGLYSHEKRFAIPFVVFASTFFFGGAAFAHYIAFPVTRMFFIKFQGDFVMFLPRLGSAFSLYVKMLLGFGVIFQMPVLVFALARMGVVSGKFLLRNFKYATLIIFVLGAVLSPGGDIASQLMMAGPMMVLYVLSIGIAFVFQKKRPAEA